MAYNINTDITMSGATLAMGSNKITGLATATAAGDATDKTYVDTAIAAGVVSLFSEDASRNIIGGTTAGNGLTAGAFDNYIAGNGAGVVLSSGDNNILIGSRSGALLTTALNNISIGVDSQTVNTTAPSNISIGKNSLIGLLSGTGTNIMLGTNSGLALTTGSANVGTGDGVLQSITSGIRNTAYGTAAGTNATGTSNDNVFLGNAAGPTTVAAISDKLYIHNAASDTPLIHGDFLSTLVTINGTLNASTALQVGGVAVALSTHIHDAFDRATATLTGGNVFSDVVVTDGIVTAISTRALAAADVGASATGHTHTESEITDLAHADLGEFTVAGLPTAATNANAYALATNASGGRTVVRSDGTNWKVIAVEGATVI